MGQQGLNIYFKQLGPLKLYFIKRAVDEDDGMYWSNQQGWVEFLGDATFYSADEKAQLSPPMEGSWHHVVLEIKEIN